MKDALYFSHDCNARNDVKILMLRQKFGWEGYGLFWALIEAMAEASEYQLDNTVITAISFNYNTDYNKLKSIIEYCCEIKLFKEENDVFWSESLKRRMELKVAISEQKSRAGKIGMAKRWGKDNTDITEDNNKRNKRNKTNNDKEVFESFRKIYPGIKRGLNTEFKDFQKHKDWQDVLPTLITIINNQISNCKRLKMQKEFVPEWKHLTTWLNKRCWEEEIETKGQVF
uniref:Lin1244/Lin1753-like N-terminal domain-containing protein n=1 Tax=viral metagenome TaxID=1070528 RepID=A0A6H1ZS87_9ZZZZ